MTELTFEDVRRAHLRIKNHIKKTPMISSEKLNETLGAQIFFKLENQQKTNSFKARGAFNAILAYQEKHGKLPEKIVVQSTGNHAQATAFACKQLGIPALIYMSKIASPFKIAATKSWGAEVIVCEKRAEANKMAEEKQKEGYFFIHPSDNDDLICGEGSAALEAIEEAGEFDAIFAPCGGGGLISSCYLAASEQKKPAQVFGCEPTNANDAAISLREGKIFHFADSPNTIADGVRTLAVSPRCFHYLKKLAGILEISEEEILVWQKKFQEVFAMKIEPTSALAFAGATKFLQKNPQEKNPKILVIISGGNLES